MLMSKKVTTSAILMEPASFFFFKGRGLRAVVEWTPRDCNRKADASGNGNDAILHPAKVNLLYSTTARIFILPVGLLHYAIRSVTDSAVLFLQCTTTQGRQERPLLFWPVSQASLRGGSARVIGFWVCRLRLCQCQSPGPSSDPLSPSCGSDGPTLRRCLHVPGPVG